MPLPVRSRRRAHASATAAGAAAAAAGCWLCCPLAPLMPTPSSATPAAALAVPASSSAEALAAALAIASALRSAVRARTEGWRNTASTRPPATHPAMSAAVREVPPISNRLAVASKSECPRAAANARLTCTSLTPACKHRLALFLLLLLLRPPFLPPLLRFPPVPPPLPGWQRGRCRWADPPAPHLLLYSDAAFRTLSNRWLRPSKLPLPHLLLQLLPALPLLPLPCWLPVRAVKGSTVS